MNGALDQELFYAQFQRLRAGASQATAIAELSRWISDNTFIQGKPYSYLHHEYQERILNSTAVEKVCRKCSQVGISELAISPAARARTSISSELMSFST